MLTELDTTNILEIMEANRSKPEENEYQHNKIKVLEKIMVLNANKSPRPDERYLKVSFETDHAG